MARRHDRGVERSEAERAAAVARELDRRYRRLADYGMAADPPWPLSASIRTERDRIDRTGGSITARLRRLECFLDGLGVLDEASAHADRFRGSWR